MAQPSTDFDRRCRHFSAVLLIALALLFITAAQAFSGSAQRANELVVDGEALSAGIDSGKYTLATEALGHLAV